MEAQAQAGCTEYNAVRRPWDCIVHFRRKYLKGLLSIPSHGRGARRPLGQSFHESVGPAEHPLLASSYPLSQPVVVSSGFGESHCMCQGKHLSDSASSEDLVRISAKANGHCLRLQAMSQMPQYD